MQVTPIDHATSPGPPTPPASRRPRVVTPIAAVAVAIGLQLVASVVVTAAAAVRVMAADPTAAAALRADPNQVGRLVAGALHSPVWITLSLFTTEVLLLGFVLLLARLSPEKLRIRLSLVPPVWRRVDALQGYVVGAVGCLGVSEVLHQTLVFTVGDSPSIQGYNAAVAAASPGVFAAFLFAGALCAPVAEELLFRGYVQSRLAERFSPAIGIAATSVMFGIFHLEPRHGVMAGAIGFFLGWLAFTSRSVLPGVAAHVVNNLAAFMGARLGLTETGWWTMPVGIIIATLAIVRLRALGARARDEQDRTSQAAGLTGLAQER